MKLTVAYFIFLLVVFQLSLSNVVDDIVLWRYGHHRCTCVFLILQVREIEGLNHLTHLRVLNLAGNDISCVTNLSGLQALAELNLRRNRITSIVSYTQCVYNMQ